MDSVSRPLIALLLGTVAVFAVWLVALKPSSSGGGASTASPGAYASAIAKAHAAVATSAAASVAHGGTVLTAAPPSSVATGAPYASSAAQPVAAGAARAGASAATGSTTWAVPPELHPSRSAAASRMDAVTRALMAQKTLALLFFNAAGADARAVRQELAAVPAHGGSVVKLAVRWPNLRTTRW